MILGFKKFSFLLGTSLILTVTPGLVYSQNVPAKPTEAPKQKLSSWKVSKAKTFPHYKIEILERWSMGKFPRVDSMKARIIPLAGGPVTEFEGVWITPDPKDFVEGWAGGKLDFTGDGLEDLMIRNSTGGAHCCYSYSFFSLTKPLKTYGSIDLQDCGELIQLKDLNGNGKPEIISCDAKFTYLGNLPYSESPFPLVIYTLGAQGYERADKNFKQVYLADIEKQKQILAKGYKPSAALQIVTDYFLMGEESKGWEEFEKLYQGKDKEKIKLQLLQKLGLKIQMPAPTPSPNPNLGPPTAPIIPGGSQVPNPPANDALP